MRRSAFPWHPTRHTTSSHPLPAPLAPTELRDRLAAGERLVLLDVREPDEFAYGHIPGSLHVPLGELARRHVELDPDAAVVCICHHGVRSAGAARALVALGFERVFNLTGGVERWAVEVDRSMPRY